MAKKAVHDKTVHRWLERWHNMDNRSRAKKERWLKLFDSADLSHVSADVRSQLELVAQLIRRTMPKKEGGVDED